MVQNFCGMPWKQPQRKALFSYWNEKQNKAKWVSRWHKEAEAKVAGITTQIKGDFFL